MQHTNTLFVAVQNGINILVRGAHSYCCAVNVEEAQSFPLTTQSNTSEYILVREVIRSNTYVSTLQWHLLILASE